MLSSFLIWRVFPPRTGIHPVSSTGQAFAGKRASRLFKNAARLYGDFLDQRSKVFITENAEDAENTEGLQRPIIPTTLGFDRRAQSARQKIRRLIEDDACRAARRDTSVFSAFLYVTEAVSS